MPRGMVGAAGALVNLGGDLRAAGTPPVAAGWTIGVPHPAHPDRELLRVAVPHGAVATSSRLRRRWATPAGPAHHLIDPATGRPAATGVVAATVVADQAWRAEALTKLLVLAGPGELRRHDDVHAVVVTADSASLCSEACAAGRPVLLDRAHKAGPGKLGALHRRLEELGYLRPPGAPWPAALPPPLAPAAAVAAAIRGSLPPL